MNKPEFSPIVLTNKQDLEKNKKDAEIVINYIERARNMYIEFFGNFDIDFFNVIFTSRKPHLLYKEVVTEYIKVKGIDLRGIKLDKALQIGLLDLPDLGKLIDRITDIKRLNSNGGFISNKDIKEIYSYDEERFLSPFEPESIVGQRIEKAIKLETETESENTYLKQVESFASMYVTFLNEYKVVQPRESIPGNLFKLEETNEGKYTYSISPSALLSHREERKRKMSSGFIH